MCGICGFVYADTEHPVDRRTLERMTRILAHRGPDDEGMVIGRGIGLGHRRLSIIGLNDGRQPMATEDGSVQIVYNGELYSHPQQRRALEQQGYCYRTSSDTETFLHLYRAHGLSFLDQVEGMFALALWDESRRRLVLARDHAGIKPLYYYHAPWGVVFASELKSLLQNRDIPRELDLDAVNHFLTFMYVPAPRSILKGVRKLLPGRMLVYENNNLEERMFWNPVHIVRDSISERKISHADNIRAIREHVSNAVRSHLLSDVQVGAFLSGGIDSSIVTYIMAQELGSRFPTFSIGFEDVELFDETQQAREYARWLGTDHHEVRLNPRDLMRNLPNLIWQVDEPMADSSCLPVYEVSKLARQHVKVVLSGDGADELFAGYRKYIGEYYFQRIQWMPRNWLASLSKWGEGGMRESRVNWFWDRIRQGKKFLRGLHPDAFIRHYRWASYIDDAWRHELWSHDCANLLDVDGPRTTMRECFESCPDCESLSGMLWTDLFFGLPDDMLTKVDRMSMFHSLEVRVPFLDRRLMETSLQLPTHLKLQGRQTKWTLREVFRSQLPAAIFDRPKHGFDVPIGEWFRAPLKPIIEDVIDADKVKARGLFQPHILKQMLEAHISRKRDFSNQLWQLLILEWWQREYLDRQPSLCPPGEQEWPL